MIRKKILNFLMVFHLLGLIGVVGAAELHKPNELITDPRVALELLKKGNARFVANEPIVRASSNDRPFLLAGQWPFAVVVCCSDSRVPPELFFNQQLGDLFVVRVAGNVLGPIELGSIEYAVEHLKTPLVVVLGHEACGAVAAAVEYTCHANDHAHDLPPNIAAIVQRIRPSVEEVLAKISDTTGIANVTNEVNVTRNDANVTEFTEATEKVSTEDITIVEATCNKNIEKMVEIIRQNPIIQANRPKVIGAKCLLETGAVIWFDESQSKFVP